MSAFTPKTKLSKERKTDTTKKSQGT